MLIPPMAEILDRIEVFLERHAMPPTSFGRAATGEPQLIKSMKDGRSPSHRVLERVAAFMAKYDLDHAPVEPEASTDNRGAAIGDRACPGTDPRRSPGQAGEPEPTADHAVAASGRAPGPIAAATGPGDSLYALRPSLFDFAAGRG